MDSYSILRNNKEYGPYTLKEINFQGLLSTDLIWVEGKSSSWRNATEVDELKTFIKGPETVNGFQTKTTGSVTFTPSQTESVFQEKIFKPVPTIFVSEPAKTKAIINEPALPHSDDFGTVHNQNKWEQTNRKPFSLNYNILGLGVLLIGAVMGAFIMKLMVDSFANDRMNAVEAKEIESHNVPVNVPVSTTTHTAEASSGPSALSMSEPGTLITPDSSAEKIKMPVKPSAATVQKNNTEGMKAILKDPATGLITAEHNSNTIDTKPPVTSEKNSSEEIKKQLGTKSSLEVSANDYKVGLLGGVSGLQISVTNPTAQNIENAIVEVEFLKPNGTVVKTEIFSVQNVAAGSTKTVAVPSSNRGVKVRYRIVSSNPGSEIIATDNM